MTHIDNQNLKWQDIRTQAYRDGDRKAETKWVKEKEELIATCKQIYGRGLWWSIGHCAHLLIQQSTFKSHESLQYTLLMLF